MRDRVNALCFNGKFYTHQILLQPVDTGVKEEEILSLSNAYDINRGLPTHKMAINIIDEYRRRRELPKETHFVEWYSIDPLYPKFGPYSAGRYINGGIAGFVAGELAKAAFNHGREKYGADILRRVADKVEQDGGIRFLYDITGKDMGGGPQGWAAAAVISALVEGLADIHDDDVLFQKVTIAPRFVAADIDDATVNLRHGPSGANVVLQYHHDRAVRRITIKASGAPREYRFRILLPDNAEAPRLVEPKDTAATSETIEQSHYLACVLKPNKNGVLLNLEY